MNKLFTNLLAARERHEQALKKLEIERNIVQATRLTNDFLDYNKALSEVCNVSMEWETAEIKYREYQKLK